MAIATRYFQPAAATWVTGTAYVVGDYVLGTDNKNWRCTTAHTSAAADRPITGANYATYWEECDGTTWDKRAALFAGGAWSAVITAFNFTSGSDSLYCLIEGNKTYTISASLTSATFTSGAPSVTKPIFFAGCDSSGNALEPPDGNWTSDQPVFDTSGFPTLATTTNIATINLSFNVAFCYLLKFTATANTTGLVVQGVTVDWCYLTSSSSNTSATVYGASSVISNSVVETTGTSYGAVCNSERQYNVRVIGNSSATSGNRNGYQGATATINILRCTYINHVGSAVASTSTSTAFQANIDSCTIHGCGTGIKHPATASQTGSSRIQNCYIAGSTTAGIDLQSANNCIIAYNRLRDNGTSGNFTGTGNWPTTENALNYTTDSDDASELVNVAGGDYRIKNTATIWGKGFGVSEEPPASSAGGSFAFIG